MTPEQKIKRHILLQAIAGGDVLNIAGDSITADTVDALFEANNEDYQLQDYISGLRHGTVETGVKCEWSRHYESKAVAAKIDGEWIGWTYWYGGGKHGEPEAVEWMEHAYELDCTEEEKTVTVQTFSLKVPQPA